MKCRKCGSGNIATSFHEDEEDCRNILQFQYRFKGEHLHKYCRHCGYQWSAPCEDDDTPESPKPERP